MSTSLYGNISAALSFLNTVTPATTSASATDNLNIGVTSLPLSNGTGASQANLLFYFTETLTSSTRTWDLTSLAGTFGTVTFAKIKALYVINNSTSDGAILSVGNSGSNPWSAPWSASTTVEKVMPSSPMLKTNLLLQGTNPWTVDGTHKALLIDSGASTISYSIAIVGI